MFDLDWAPDFVTSDLVDILTSNKIKSTWFITHKSPILNFLREQNQLIELGIHPNFLPNSTQGNSMEEIISHCLNIVPEAKSMRTHAYVQSSLLFSYVVKNTNIKIDASIFTPHFPNIEVIDYWVDGGLINRIPVFWEDDNEMKIPGHNWDLKNLDISGPGLKIFAFHPIHIYLNTTELDEYAMIKQRFPSLSEAEKTDVDQFIQREKRGTRDFFLEIIQLIARQEKSYMLQELIPSKPKGK